MSRIAERLLSAADAAADLINELEQELARAEDERDIALEEVERLKFELAQVAE